MASKTGLSGIAIAEITAGLIIAWSGIEGQTVGATVHKLLSGQLPKQSPDSIASGIVPGASPTGPSSATGAAVAQDALQYQGAGYAWGGAPANGIGNWDCSSFCNWVIGHDLRMAIPTFAAGTYTGTSHGPTTIAWLSWSGCTTVGHTANTAQAGDLCVWQTHMGIAIGNGQMISAQDPADGTRVSGIGLPGELLFVRRLNAVTTEIGSPARKK